VAVVQCAPVDVVLLYIDGIDPMPHRSQYTVFAALRANGSMSAYASTTALWRWNCFA
jgi:hypothetical protein